MHIACILGKHFDEEERNEELILNSGRLVSSDVFRIMFVRQLANRL